MTAPPPPASGECPECKRSWSLHVGDGHDEPICPAPAPPSPGRMSDERFEDLAVWVETCAPAAEPFAGHYFIQEARRARESEAAWEKALRRAVEIIVGTPAAEQSREPDDLLLALTTHEEAAIKRHRSKP